MNDLYKLIKVIRDFLWHDLKETDEVFIVLDGEVAIAFPYGEVKLSKGKMYVIPKVLSTLVKLKAK